jgi:Predicted integral membrane protein (DUF2269)
VLAEVTAYNVGVFIHLIAVVVGIGPTYAYPVVLAWVERFAPQSVPPVYAALRRCDRILVTPGLVIVLLAGFYVVSEGKIEVAESWVSLGIVTVIALLGLTHAYFKPRWDRGIDLAERDLRAGGELSPEFQANSRQIAIGGMLAGLLVLVTIFFMTVKP